MTVKRKETVHLNLKIEARSIKFQITKDQNRINNSYLNCDLVLEVSCLEFTSIASSTDS